MIEQDGDPSGAHLVRNRAARGAAAAQTSPENPAAGFDRQDPDEQRPTGYRFAVLPSESPLLQAPAPRRGPQETREWLDALDGVHATHGRERADFLLRKVLKRARQLQIGLPGLVQSRYINTISPEQEPAFPGDEQMELRIRRIIAGTPRRWWCARITCSPGWAGHLATYASSASLYEVGFNHFFRGKDDGSGDQLFLQGHAAPGFYARAFLEGRLSESQLDHFRREVVPGRGCPPTAPAADARLLGVPHRVHGPWAHLRDLPGALQSLPAVARLADTAKSRCGRSSATARWTSRRPRRAHRRGARGARQPDLRGELQPAAARRPGARQRQDHPGDGIAVHRRGLERHQGDLVPRLGPAARAGRRRRADRGDDETVDGEWQRYSMETGAYVREHFFGRDPRLLAMVESLTDDQLRGLRRGGTTTARCTRPTPRRPRTPAAHGGARQDGQGLDAAPRRGQEHRAPGEEDEHRRAAQFRDRLELRSPTAKLADAPFYHPGADSDEVKYLLERRAALGGGLPRRVVRATPLRPPQEKVFAEFAAGTGEKQLVSTTMGFREAAAQPAARSGVGPARRAHHPDEARTFGMEVLFREIGIYAPFGQKYDPVDSKLVLSYTEKPDGQLLEEGITEAGSMASLQAAGTAYATHSTYTVPFYIFYSMFLQRTLDQLWASATSAGAASCSAPPRAAPTLNGEGLQQRTGTRTCWSQGCRTSRVRSGVRVRGRDHRADGLERMYTKEEDVFYYLTLYNQDIPMPPMPGGVKDGILKGLYLYRKAPSAQKLRAQILASGILVQEALRAQAMLAEHHGVRPTCGARPRGSCCATRRFRSSAGTACIRPSRRGSVRHADARRERGTDRRNLGLREAGARHDRPLGAAPVPPARHRRLRRSDTREALRRHFEVDAEHVVVAVLSSLMREGKVAAAVVEKAIPRYGIDPELKDPRDA